MLSKISPYVMYKILSNLHISDILSILQSSKFFLQYYDFVYDLLKQYEPYCVGIESILQGHRIVPKILFDTKKPKPNPSYAKCYTDEQLLFIAKTLPNLIILDMSGFNHEITDLGLQSICENCPNLMYLSIRESQTISDEGLKHLCKLTKLVSLDLYCTYRAHKEDSLMKQIIENNPNMVEIDYDGETNYPCELDEYCDSKSIEHGHCSIKFHTEEQIESLLNKRQYLRFKNVLESLKLLIK